MIFGTECPKIVSSSLSCSFEHSKVTMEWSEPDTIVHTSIVNGKKNYLTSGSFANGEISLYLYKYDNPQSKFAEVMQFKNKLVQFYPHSDSTYLQDSGSNSVPVYVSEVLLDYIYKNYHTEPDIIVNVKLLSSKYTDITKNLI